MGEPWTDGTEDGPSRADDGPSRGRDEANDAMEPRLVGDEEVTGLGMAQRSQGRMAQRSQCRMDLGMRGAEVGLIRARAESRTE